MEEGRKGGMEGAAGLEVDRRVLGGEGGKEEGGQGCTGTREGA